MIAAVIAVQVIMSNSPVQADKFVEAFKQSEFVIKESKITATVDLGKTFMNENKKQAAIKEFAKALGLDENYELVSNTKSAKKEMKLTKNSKNAVTIIKIVTNEKKVGPNIKEVQNFFAVDLTIYQDVDSVMYYKEKIEQLLKERNLDTDVIINIYGEKEGLLSDKEKSKIAKTVLDNIDGKSISEYNVGNAYNTYGYTPNIKHYIKQAGQKINIDIAITYNEADNMSCFYMATPIITIDY